MERVPSLRASDSDRERASERLRHATAEGRLTAAELEERLEALYASRTYGELDALLADLPVSRSVRGPHARVARWVGGIGALTLMVAILGMLAGLHGHSVAVVGGPGQARQFRFPGPFTGPHPGLIAAAPVVALVVVLLACAAIAWGLMQSRTSSGG